MTRRSPHAFALVSILAVGLLKGEHCMNVAGKVGYRFFGKFILDCLNRN